MFLMKVGCTQGNSTNKVIVCVTHPAVKICHLSNQYFNYKQNHLLVPKHDQSPSINQYVVLTADLYNKANHNFLR